MEKLKKAQYIAIGATVANIIGFLLAQSLPTLGSILLFGGLIAGIVAYVFGGFKAAASISWKLAKFGWLITPFPVDIMTGLGTFLIGIYVFLFIPIIPVRKAYKESLNA